MQSIYEKIRQIGYDWYDIYIVIYNMGITEKTIIQIKYV